MGKGYRFGNWSFNKSTSTRFPMSEHCSLTIRGVICHFDFSLLISIKAIKLIGTTRATSTISSIMSRVELFYLNINYQVSLYSPFTVWTYNTVPEFLLIYAHLNNPLMKLVILLIILVGSSMTCSITLIVGVTMESMVLIGVPSKLASPSAIP